MKMTLFVDASFCPKTLAAGWGSWAIRDDWSKGRNRGGPLNTKHPVTSSNAAEIAGIGASLWQHSQLGDLQGLSSLMIQCDNTAALGFIATKIPRAVRSGKQLFSKAKWGDDPLISAVMATVCETLAGVPLIDLRHVKGHSGLDDGRSWVNRKCDSEAKKNMILQRKRLLELQSG